MYNELYSMSPHEKVHWLNGLRGFASLIVCLNHLIGATKPFLLFPFGAGPEPEHASWLKLPFIRLLYAGNAMVGIFFVVSGYAITLNALRYAGAEEWDKFSKIMSSSVVRRSGRLLLPTLASSLLAMMLAQLGAFEQKVPPNVIFAITASRRPSWQGQASRWLLEMEKLLSPWDQQLGVGVVPDLEYGVQLWTIPLELWCSFVVYLHIFALAPVSRMVRRTLLCISAAYYLSYGRWDVFLFLAGMLLADLHPGSTDSLSYARLPTSHQPVIPHIDALGGSRMQAWKKVMNSKVIIRCALATSGLLLSSLLLSQPEIQYDQEMSTISPQAHRRSLADISRGYVPSSLASDCARFWIALGAPVFVLSIGHGPDAFRWIFQTRAAQYLGSLSFAFYLTHNVVIRIFGAWVLYSDRTQNHDVHWTGLGLVAAFLVIVMASLLVADIFRRLVDEPINHLMKKFASNLMAGGNRQFFN